MTVIFAPQMFISLSNEHDILVSFLHPHSPADTSGSTHCCSRSNNSSRSFSCPPMILSDSCPSCTVIPIR